MGPERSGVCFTIGGWLSTLLDNFSSSGFGPRRAGRRRPGTPPAPPLNLAAPPPADEPPPAEAEPAEEVTPPPPSNTSPLVITGYVDVGFAKAQGDGTSFPGLVRHRRRRRGPADYYVDTFAPAVNSRGEAASIAAPPGTTIGGFLPRSAGIGGKPSFLINTADVDLRYTAPELPIMIFTRLQVLPRLYNAIPMTTPPTPDTSEGMPAGEYTRLYLEQAFGRITPLKSAELAISLGKFDSVFGIEYLDNEANFRVGVTPSLIARYTTGQSTGLKVFYRYQIIPASSAISVNVAATNSGTFVEALQGPSRSLTGVPIVAGRLGYELNLPRVSIKVGGSAEYGPRNDQYADRPQAPETLLRVRRAGDPADAGPLRRVRARHGRGRRRVAARRDRPQAGGHRRLPGDHRVLRARLLDPGGRGAAALDRSFPDHALRPLRAAARRSSPTPPARRSRSLESPAA